MTDIATTLHHASTQRRPRDDEIDSYGVTHPGKVRPDNQDHFLIGRLRGRLDIRVSSLPDADRLPIEEERVGSIMMVADGVGGGLKGEKASRIALEEITQYISEAARCYYRDNDGDQDFMHALERAACIVHEKVVEQAAGDPEAEGMATTLTLFIGVWPWTYLLQVGDSRYYRFADGVLSQVSHDQTLAQALVDQGIMSQKLSANSPLSSGFTTVRPSRTSTVLAGPRFRCPSSTPWPTTCSTTTPTRIGSTRRVRRRTRCCFAPASGSRISSMHRQTRSCSDRT